MSTTTVTSKKTVTRGNKAPKAPASAPAEPEVQAVIEAATAATEALEAAGTTTTTETTTEVTSAATGDTSSETVTTVTTETTLTPEVEAEVQEASSTEIPENMEERVVYYLRGLDELINAEEAAKREVVAAQKRLGRWLENMKANGVPRFIHRGDRCSVLERSGKATSIRRASSGEDLPSVEASVKSPSAKSPSAKREIKLDWE